MTPTPERGSPSFASCDDGTPASEYVVQDGDTLFEIAERFGASVDEVISCNAGLDLAIPHVGQALVIPVVTHVCPYVLAPGSVRFESSGSDDDPSILAALDCSNAVFIAAVAVPSADPLSAIFTESALACYEAYVEELSSKGLYENARVAEAAVDDLKWVDNDNVVVSTYERWTYERGRSGDDVVTSNDSVDYGSYYELRRTGARWLVRVNSDGPGEPNTSCPGVAIPPPLTASPGCAYDLPLDAASYPVPTSEPDRSILAAINCANATFVAAADCGCTDPLPSGWTGDALADYQQMIVSGDYQIQRPLAVVRRSLNVSASSADVETCESWETESGATRHFSETYTVVSLGARWIVSENAFQPVNSC